jgi:hypothetical protein
MSLCGPRVENDRISQKTCPPEVPARPLAGVFFVALNMDIATCEFDHDRGVAVCALDADKSCGTLILIVRWSISDASPA